MALKEVVSQKPSSPYYSPPPLHILVIEKIEQPRVLSWEFRDNSATAGVTKINTVASITDGKSVAKVTLFEEFGSKIKEGISYIMKGYNVRGQCPPLSIIITKQTLFFRASTINASDELIKSARDLLRPNSTLTPLSACGESQAFLTVQGKVIEISAVKKVSLGREQVPFRTILLQQEKVQQSLCLWREAAIYDVPLGGTLTVIHLKHAKGDYGFRLQTTAFTKMEAEVSDTLESVEVIGVMEASEGILNLLLADETVLEIDQKLWEPLDDLLKVDKVVVNISKVGTRITTITPTQGQK